MSAGMVAGFASTSTTNRRYSTSTRLNAATEAEFASFLTDFMAKSHQDKLDAVAQVEAKKNEQISQLKEELDTLKSGKTALAPAVEAAPLATSSKVQELEVKLQAFQKFMADYIVKAQAEKLRAVQEAEERVLKNLGALPAAKQTAPKAPTNIVVVKENPSYTSRNENVIKAASAGKSRWSNAEVERIQKAKTTTTTATTSNNVDSKVQELIANPPQSVVDADHGLRADGGVGGLTLAERVAMGFKAPTSDDDDSSTTTTPTAFVASYAQRNDMVSRAAAMGKSRWDDREVARVKKWNEEHPNALLLSSSSKTRINVGASVGVVPPTAKSNGRINIGASLLK